MATQIVGGPRTWRMSRDEEGNREYKVVHLVKSDVTDGPYNVLNTPGLPLVGAIWSFMDDNDPWAWCRPDALVTIHQEREGDPNRYWAVENTFSSKPLKKCSENAIEDPLLEPPKIGGSFSKFTEEATHDRFGRPICSSSFEQYRGSQVEFDANRPSVRIEMNVAVLQLGLLSQMVDTVNDAEVWGLSPRTVKLSNVSWERKFYGLCYMYYTLVLDFEINFKTWDRILLDEGSKVLNGEWDEATGNFFVMHIGGGPPDHMNPGHFRRAIDRVGNPTRFILNGRGLPAGVVAYSPDMVAGAGTGTGTESTNQKTEVGYVLVEKYEESNFLLLGIPLDF